MTYSKGILSSKVSTAARRIARELNDNSRAVDVLFNADGTVAGSVEHGNVNPEINERYVFEFRLQGRRDCKVSQREAQDIIDRTYKLF